jgi:hypothetical protein
VEGALVGVGGLGDGEEGAGTAKEARGAPGAAGAVDTDCRVGGETAAAPAVEAEAAAGGVVGLEAVGVVSMGGSSCCCREMDSTPSLIPCGSSVIGGGSL